MSTMSASSGGTTATSLGGHELWRRAPGLTDDEIEERDGATMQLTAASIDRAAAQQMLTLLRQFPHRHTEPVMLRGGGALQRALGVLDRTLSVTTHKVGVVYVAPGQRSLQEALRNSGGSTRYNALLHELGRFERLADDGTRHRYTGGLDRSADGIDGEHALFWSDHFSLIVYHVCTLMPTRESDRESTHKLRHIGNDYVNIVFSAHTEIFDHTQFKGQHNLVTVVVYPKRLGLYRIDVLEKQPGALMRFGPLVDLERTAAGASIVVSRTALHRILRAIVMAADQAAAIYVDGLQRRQANAEVRMKQIQRMADFACK